MAKSPQAKAKADKAQIATDVTKTLRRLGLSTGTKRSGLTRGELAQQKETGLPIFTDPEAARVAGTLGNSLSQLNRFKELERKRDIPGTSPEAKASLNAQIESLSGPINQNLSQLVNLGFDPQSFGPIFQPFADKGFEFIDSTQPGGIDVRPPLVQPRPEPTPIEVPGSDLPPIEDVIGRQPGVPQQPAPVQPILAPQPGTPIAPPAVPPVTPPNQLRPAVQPPITAQPLTPAQPAAEQATASTPVRKIIAVPDPRVPGSLIEIPVVDRGVPGDIDRQADQFLLEREGLRQQEQQRKAFESQRAIRGERLAETGRLLQQQTARQFQEAIPGAAEVLQTKGLLQTSELEDSLAREQSRLGAIAQEGLAGQALADREAEIQAIGQILGQRQQFQRAGLERQFSLEDFEKEAQVARETGASITPHVRSVSGGEAALSGGVQGAAVGSQFGPKGALIGGVSGAAIGLMGGGSKGSPSYLCTKLKQLGLMTEEEVDKVHDRIFTSDFTYFADLLLYGLFAPMFIKRMEKEDFDWVALKSRLCDEVLNCETSEEAFNQYKDVCTELFSKEFPVFRFLVKSNEVMNHG